MSALDSELRAPGDGAGLDGNLLLDQVRPDACSAYGAIGAFGASDEKTISSVQAAPAPDSAAAVAFLKQVYPEGPWCVTALDPETNRAPETRTFYPITEASLLAWLTAYNGSRNLYWHVNPVRKAQTKKASREDIEAVCYLHVDVDPGAGQDLITEREKILDLLTDRRPPRVPEPTIVLSSGGGYQAFWKLQDPIALAGNLARADDAARYNQQLEVLFGADNCHNIDRLMRLPGTINLPDERKRKKGRKPARAELLYLKPDNVYPLCAFTPANAAPETAAQRKKGAIGNVKVDLNVGVRRITTVDQLDSWNVPDRIKIIIAEGHHPEPDEQSNKNDTSRSAWLFDVVCNLVRCKVPDDIIFGIITDPRWAISESVLEKKGQAEKYAIKQIASAKLNLEKPSGAIIVNNPVLAELRRQIEQLLLDKGLELFRQDKRLVRVSIVEETVMKDGVVRHPGMVELVPVTSVWLADKASELGRFVLIGEQGSRRVAPTRENMAGLLEITDESRFPLIRGLSLTPTLSCDKPGYDEESQLFLSFPEGLFPAAPMKPSFDEARRALTRLASPLRGFPFIDRAARSVALSAMISAVVRPELRTCPLHGFDAPAAGSGKTKLALMAGLLALGVEPPSVTFGEEADENQKQLSSLLMTGCGAILLDNVDLPLKGAFLNGILTKDGFDTRILGLSKMVKLSTRALLMATGNNLRCQGDMARRAVMCRLDARMSNPEDRQFDFDPVVEVREARPQLVVDALTVVRGYLAAGRPGKLSAFGSFDDWNLVRGALVWLGEADPLDTKAMIAANNPKLQERAELVLALLKEFGIGRRFKLAQIDAQPDTDANNMKGVLGRMLPSGRWHKGQAGALLTAHKDVPFMGLTLTASQNRTGVNEWRLDGSPDQALIEEAGRREADVEIPF
jgi:hypothetical protein